MAQGAAIVTNVLDYAGPPAVAGLLGLGMPVLCHAAMFADPDARSRFEAAHPGATAAVAQAPEQLVEEAVTRFGGIVAVVSNDAGDIRRGPVVERTADDLRDLFERLTVAPFRLARAALPLFTAQGSGRIILITSAAPLRPVGGLVAYSAARAATNAMAKALAVEVGPSGIAVNAVAPFYLASNYFPIGMDDPDVARVVTGAVPMGRLGTEDEFANLIAALASGSIDFVSGQVIAFSGGGA